MSRIGGIWMITNWRNILDMATLQMITKRKIIRGKITTELSLKVNVAGV